MDQTCGKCGGELYLDADAPTARKMSPPVWRWYCLMCGWDIYSRDLSQRKPSRKEKKR